MGKPILFVVNPISGDQNKEVLIREINLWSDQNGFSAHFYKTTGQGDFRAIQEQIQDTGSELVVAVGGDGTVRLCATLLRDTDRPLGIIPAGSANGMATDLRIPENVPEALDILKDGDMRKIDLLEFDGEELGMHISDVGLNAGLIKKFEEGEYRGFLGYARGLIDKVQNVREFEVKIKTGEDKAKRFTTYMIAVANAQRYGTGALLNTLGKIDDGLMEICVFEDLDLLNISRHFLEQLTEDESHYHIIQCAEANITVLNTQEPFQIDGEYKGEKEEIYVKVLPQCLHVKVPH